MIGLVGLIGYEMGIACRELGHHLAAPDLEQDVVLGIEVVGRDRKRRGYEDEPLRGQHRTGRGLDLGTDFLEQAEQQRFVGGHLLDIFEHRPTLRLGDLADRLGDGQAVRFRLAVDPDRQIAAIVFDAGQGELLGQRSKCLDLEQRMAGEAMLEDMRLLGIMPREFGARGGVEHVRGQGIGEAGGGVHGQLLGRVS